MQIAIVTIVYDTYNPTTSYTVTIFRYGYRPTYNLGGPILYNQIPEDTMQHVDMANRRRLSTRPGDLSTNEESIHRTDENYGGNFKKSTEHGFWMIMVLIVVSLWCYQCFPFRQVCKFPAM